MPDPGYQRESATTLWSTRTARTLEGPPRRRCGVRSYLARRLVQNPRLNGYQRLRLAGERCCDIGFPRRDMDRPGYVEPDMAINARPGIPARVGHHAVVDADRQDVGRPAQTEVRRQVVLKGGVAVWPGAKQDTVDPDGAVAIHAIETDGDFPATRGDREGERLPVPGAAARQKARAARVLRAVGAFDRPIVRQADLSPILIGEGCRLSLIEVAQMKAPPVIEELAFARHLRVARHNRQE